MAAPYCLLAERSVQPLSWRGGYRAPTEEGESERMNRDEFAQQVLDELRAALDDDRLTNDEMRMLIKILRPVAERSRQRARHGGPSAAQIERN